MSDAGRDAVEKLEAALAVERAETARLRAENDELKALLAEVQKALDAAEGDVARYRALFEQNRPHCPERVPSVEQQLVFLEMLESLRVETAAPANDAAALEPEVEPEVTTPPAPTPPPAGGSPGPKGHGRRPLDLSSLPVQTVVIDPPEVIAASGVGYTLIGAEPSDRLAYSPASYVRLRLVRRTFRRDDVPAESAQAITTASDDATGSSPADPETDVAPVEQPPPPDAHFVTAPVPGAVWPRLLADPSVLAHAIVSKYDDLLPLHRQEGITRREGFTVPRSTQCGWFGPAERVMCRIVDAMFADAKATTPCLATDATGASVRRNKGPCDSWHVFVFVAERDHIVFRHSRTHDSVALGLMLRGYRGLLLGDATSIYSPLVTAGIIVLCCCWAHVRRYFFKAIESDRTRSLEAVAMIGQLFAIERACARLPTAEKTARRAELARPILQLFDDWLDRHRASVDERSPLRAAITYADNQRHELRRFLEDGRIRLDNNVCEGQLRHLVLGLNNWQYFENENGLRWYTVFRSLIASCKLHGLCPQRYLECVLRLAPHWSQRRMLALSPKYWRATAARLSPEQLAIVRPAWSSAFDVFAPPAADVVPTDGAAAAA